MQRDSIELVRWKRVICLNLSCDVRLFVHIGSMDLMASCVIPENDITLINDASFSFESYIWKVNDIFEII